MQPTFSKRDAHLLDLAKDTLKRNVFPETKEYFEGRNMISPSREGFPGVWNWDAAFHAVGASLFDRQLAFDQIEGFLSLMKPDGMLPDYVLGDGKTGWHSSKPPVFPWAAWKVFERHNDTAFLERIYDKLCLNERFWRENRFDNGGFFYSAYLKGTDEELYLWSGWESGWDNSPRWDNGINNLYPVDLNCFMLMFYRAMKNIAETLKKPTDEWETKAHDMETFIEREFWNETLNAYTDKDRLSGNHSSTLTPASFMPLYVHTASKERAEHMAKLAAREDKFGKLMPTVTYDDPAYSTDYWRGPMWLNVAYFAAKGLKDYGFFVADEIKENVLALVDKCGPIRENYDCKNGVGLFVENFSWSAVFILEFLLDF